jgi:hypothetical protein
MVLVTKTGVAAAELDTPYWTQKRKRKRPGSQTRELKTLGEPKGGLRRAAAEEIEFNVVTLPLAWATKCDHRSSIVRSLLQPSGQKT